MNKERRKIVKNLGIFLAGGLVYPSLSYAAKWSKKGIRRLLEPSLDDFTQKIIEIESGWDCLAMGENEDRGLMQITPIVLKEWNNLKKPRYSKDDLFNPFKNVQVGRWYFEDRIEEVYLPRYGLDITAENKIAMYNVGPSGLAEILRVKDAMKDFDKLPLTTQNYIRKYHRLSRS